MAIGNIMAAVAVFDTKALNTAVAIMKPNTIREGLVATRRNVNKAIRRSRPQRRIASDSKNPPKNKKINGWA